MGIGDYVDKAKQALAGREEQVAGALDKAADAVKSRTGADTDRKIDSAVGKAKDFLAKQGDGHRDAAAPGHSDPRGHTATPGTSGHTAAPGTTATPGTAGPAAASGGADRPGRDADRLDADTTRPDTAH